jgi:hypothetical protein
MKEVTLVSSAATGPIATGEPLPHSSGNKVRVSRMEGLSSAMARCSPDRTFVVQLADVFLLWKISQSRRRLTEPEAPCLGCQLKVRAGAGPPRCGTTRSDNACGISDVIRLASLCEFVLCTLLGRSLLPVVAAKPVDR